MPLFRTMRKMAALIVSTAMVVGGPGSANRQAQAQEETPKPNIVFILTDDEDVAIHAFMPKTKALLEEQGTTFDNAFATYPLCCPSRATILRGQYAHNHKIEGNQPPIGGYEKFHDLGHEDSTVGTWLQAAGYHTAFMGKYLNRYAPEAPVPPGWDEWYATGNAYFNVNYTLNENGALVSYGEQPRDFLNDVMARKADATIREATEAGRPFFLFISTFTPHSPEAAAPRHRRLFFEEELPMSPSFNEADMSDKTALLRAHPLLEPTDVAELEARYRRRLQSLQSVDDMVESVINTLTATGQLANTYVVYASDNGFHLGEHRMIAGKNTAFEEDIRVPLIVRGPGVPVGSRLDHMVLNNDIAPTFADMAGVDPPEFVDGRSFLPLLMDPNLPWRRSFAIERRVLERINGEVRVGPTRFNAIRTAHWTYVEYQDSPERELYDLEHDPYQLENLFGRSDPALVKALSSRISELLACAGAECRRVEDSPIEH